jgi:hypothetical protein
MTIDAFGVVGLPYYYHYQIKIIVKERRIKRKRSSRRNCLVKTEVGKFGTEVTQVFDHGLSWGFLLLHGSLRLQFWWKVPLMQHRR